MSAHSLIIVGAGPGGLCMAAKLREAGYEDFVILERAGGVGGTWRYNSYPGAACDIPSHFYSFSFFRNPEWSLPFSRQPEILAYLERMARELDLERHLRLGVEVHGLRWDDAKAHWHVDTSQGELVAPVVVSAVGMFGEPSRPTVAGESSFTGDLIHSARWDPDYELAGKSVAVVGSGASAIQLVPEIAPLVARLHHFQRSPQWIGPKRGDEAFTAKQIEQFRTDPSATEAMRAAILDVIDSTITFPDPEVGRAAEQAGLANLAMVEDPVTRAKLMPEGRYGCHRPLSSNVFYPTFNLPHVEVVREPMERFTTDSIVTIDGVERPVDVVFFATGFATTKFLSVVDVVGRDGHALADSWADGPSAYLGITVAGFPNLFMVYGPNTNNGSILWMIECQVAYIVRKIERMSAEGLRSLEVKADTVLQYNEQLQEDLAGVDVWNFGCTGYYRTDSGRIVTQWPHTMGTYAERTERPDDDAYVTVAGS